MSIKERAQEAQFRARETMAANPEVPAALAGLGAGLIVARLSGNGTSNHISRTALLGGACLLAGLGLVAGARADAKQYPIEEVVTEAAEAYLEEVAAA